MVAGALAVRDDVEGGALQINWDAAASTRASPASDRSVATGITGAGGNCARRDVRARDGGQSLHHSDVIGSEARALVVVGMLKHTVIELNVCERGRMPRHETQTWKVMFLFI